MANFIGGILFAVAVGAAWFQIRKMRQRKKEKREYIPPSGSGLDTPRDFISPDDRLK